ncbi:B3 domain-containing protein [Striga asiatica]|uniref:B3 domain-containing protein n=1 Tax=Striga asiatica TaxID=4170 RepID=A0A5A7Q1U9_STRAF|nr:B3 domain-containing protein [Striga asiatica]
MHLFCSIIAAVILHVPYGMEHMLLMDLSKLCYLFNKQLKNSDVSSLRRMVLPKKDAETHLPVLETKEGISIYMLDMDGVHDWWFKYRYWPNNSSRMYVLESTGGFVNAHHLVTGDYILVYQNSDDGRYVIEAKKKVEYEASRAFNEHLAINESTADSQFPPIPDQENLYEYEYEYNAAFMDDSPLDYVGDSINLPRFEPEINFESMGDYDNKDLL